MRGAAADRVHGLEAARTLESATVVQKGLRHDSGAGRKGWTELCRHVNLGKRAQEERLAWAETERLGDRSEVFDLNVGTAKAFSRSPPAKPTYKTLCMLAKDICGRGH